MPLKNLRNFLKFDKSFFDNKELVYLGSKLTHDNKLKVSLLIIKDNTEYQNDQTNLGEQVVVTVNNKGIDDYSSFIPMKTIYSIWFLCTTNQVFKIGNWDVWSSFCDSVFSILIIYLRFKC